jgi:hypothetical protein
VLGVRLSGDGNGGGSKSEDSEDLHVCGCWWW